MYRLNGSPFYSYRSFSLQRKRSTTFDFFLFLLAFVAVLEEIVVINPEIVLVFLVVLFLYQIYFRIGAAFYSSLNEVVKSLAKIQTIYRTIPAGLFRKFSFNSWVLKHVNIKFIYFRLYDNILFVEE